MKYSDVLALLDCDTMTDMLYEDKEKGGPCRSLEQLVFISSTISILPF